MKVLVHAFAKVNLGLDVIGVRADGYHDLDGVMQMISLYDEVEVTVARGSGVTLHCNIAALESEDNLVCKAARAFLEAADQKDLSVDIRLQKNIPSKAGLGGGSSDAAAVLLALQKLTGECMGDAQLSAIALRLGADVPFFLGYGTARAGGVGEKLSPLPLLSEGAFVVAKSCDGVSTPAAFKGWDREIHHFHPDTDALCDAVAAGDLQKILHLAGNALEGSAKILCPQICDTFDQMQAAGAQKTVMSGSGAAVFSLFSSVEQAMAVQQRLDKNIWSVVCTPKEKLEIFE